MVRTIHNCHLCDYKTDRKYDRDKHVQKKHAQNHSGSGVLQNVHQTSKQQQNVYQAQDVRACIKQWQEAYQNMSARNKQLEKEKGHIFQYYNAQSSRAPTTVSVGPDCAKAPTTLSVPPLGSTDQYGAGVDMDMDNESVDSDDEDDEITPDIMDILSDIDSTFTYLKYLRKQYRDSLPQIKEFDDEEMDEFLESYSLIKAGIIEERDGLEATVTQRGGGIDDSESEGETDEEAVDDPDDDDDTGDNADTEDTDEEAVDDTDEDTPEAIDSEEEDQEDYHVKFDKVDETEANKEYFFDFVMEAETFLDNKSKKIIEKYVRREKRDTVLADGREQDETDMPEDVDDVIEDIEHVIDLWNEREERCFNKCSKRKIMSVSNIANILTDAKSLYKIKKINPSKFNMIQNMIRPHKNSFEKLINSKVSVHEKRKVLQKSQVGGDILDAALNLVIPALKASKKRKSE